MALTTIFPPSQCVLNLVNTNQSTRSLTSAIYSLVHRPLPLPPSLEKINKWFFSDIYFYQSVSCSSSWSIHVISYFLQLSEKWLFYREIFLLVCWLIYNVGTAPDQLRWELFTVSLAPSTASYLFQPSGLDSIQTGDCLHYQYTLWIALLNMNIRSEKG